MAIREDFIVRFLNQGFGFIRWKRRDFDMHLDGNAKSAGFARADGSFLLTTKRSSNYFPGGPRDNVMDLFAIDIRATSSN